jgi:hypothetical protein
MKKEFVPYVLAVELKELGFDEETVCLFNRDRALKSNITSNPFGDRIEKDIHDERLPAPLYQQAFRWFREKYNLDSFVKHLYKSTIKVGYYFGIDEYKGVEFQMDFDVWYNTYEEAELECLKKLIEIVK